jgi:hypothetical protein
MNSGHSVWSPPLLPLLKTDDERGNQIHRLHIWIHELALGSRRDRGNRRTRVRVSVARENRREEMGEMRWGWRDACRPHM